MENALKPGSLVIHRMRGGVLHLTPIDTDCVEDLDNWIEWRRDDCGLVLDSLKGQVGIRVFVPGGVGLCFHDELIQLDEQAF